MRSFVSGLQWVGISKELLDNLPEQDDACSGGGGEDSGVKMPNVYVTIEILLK